MRAVLLDTRGLSPLLLTGLTIKPLGSARIAVLALTCLCLAPGCSWIFTEPLNSGVSFRDSDSSGGQPVLHCSTNLAPPVIDTLLTITNLGSAIYVAGQNNVSNKGSATALGLVVASLWFSSAYYGYSHTSECKETLGDQDWTDMTRARPVGVRSVPSSPRPPSRTPTQKPPAASHAPPPGDQPAQPATSSPSLPAPFSQ